MLLQFPAMMIEQAKGEGMNWERVEKRLGSENLRRLHAARVGVVGLGSGGGFVALSLAMSGVGNFALVDPDSLEVGNVVRHVCDLRALGQPKAQAVAELIRQRNPEANVETHNIKIQERWELLDDLDLLIVGVDGEASKYAVNVACLERGLTAIYGGVYERGEGGDVVTIRPGHGPCYACWAAQLRDELEYPEEIAQVDYGISLAEQALRVEPGLWLDVVRVAAAQAQHVLIQLLRASADFESAKANTLVMANRDMEIFTGILTPAQSAVWVEVERNPNCLVCGETMVNVEEDDVSLEQLRKISQGENQEESEDLGK